MNPGSSNATRRLLLWLSLCFAIRAGCGLWLAIQQPDRFVGGDGKDYLDPARNIVAGHGYSFNDPRVWDWAAYDPSLSEEERRRPKPETFRPPLYSMVLAGVVALFANPLPAVALMNALFAAGAGFFLHDLARRAMSERAAHLGLWLYSLYPVGVALTARVGVEALFEACLCGTAWALWRAKEGTGPRCAILAGLLLGVATLARSNAVFLWPLACAWLFWFVPRMRASVLWLSLALVVVLFPWTARNRIVTGHWIVLSASGPYNLWLGNNAIAYKMFTARTSAEYDEWGKRLLNEIVPGKVRELGTDDIGQAQAFWKGEAIAYVTGHPGAWCRLIAAKGLEFWRPYVRPGFFPGAMVILSLVAMLPLLVAGGAGLILLFRHNPPLAWLLLAIIVAGMSGLVLSHVHVRLRVPFVDTFFTICAAHVVVTYWPRWSKNA